MNTVLLLFILSFILDVKATLLVDRIRAGYRAYTVPALVTAVLSVAVCIAGIVKWCSL